MPVVILFAAALILGGVVVVAMGRGGELSRDRSELPGRPDFRTWSDVANYRPPGALLGYNAAVTEHALALIARAIAERDAEIDWLRSRLAEVSAAHRAGPGGSAPDYPAGFPADSDPDGNARRPAGLIGGASATGELGPPPEQHHLPGTTGWQSQAVPGTAAGPAGLRGQQASIQYPGEGE